MLFLYQIGIRIYYFLILAVAPFSGRARHWIRGRRKDRGLPETCSHDSTHRSLWMHVSSLGEFEQGRPLIEKWKEAHPGDRIYLSFYSPSGYTVRKNYPLADHIFYLPLDTKKNMNRLIGRIQPDLFILVKYDFWPNLLSCLDQHAIPVYLISSRFREGQYLFRGWGRVFLNQIRRFDHIFVQDAESQQLLDHQGIKQVTIAGDTRVDAVMSRLPRHASRITHHVLIAGSTWPAEEKMLAAIWLSAGFKQLREEWKLILAPHDTGESHLTDIDFRFGGRLPRYSELLQNPSLEWAILLVDTVGHLKDLYAWGSLALIGGGFGAGIHNILEPSAYGLPVFFGPRWEKFREAHDLIEAGSAFPFRNQDELARLLKQFLSDPALLSETGQLALNYMENQQGSTDLIIRHLMEKIQQ